MKIHGAKKTNRANIKGAHGRGLSLERHIAEDESSRREQPLAFHFGDGSICRRQLYISHASASPAAHSYPHLIPHSSALRSESVFYTPSPVSGLSR
jgi:hypothetical protein